ncbi:mediator of DNA damage checkpoint protein 1-like [Anopheles bellator]|uniref:mediator of DNA damage checkpoint protein 1-like n=1 Tax=Anopheles bellator TaxID=139047 RepID=UPI0026494379|nr:mediator of DNA damage checkpoint protein 1-like [Anopheles bellator]
MSPCNVISVIVRGVPYTIPPGLSLIGSTEHERYNSLLVADQTVSPKHASIRYDSATNRLEVMDLCSHSGVTVDQRPLDPLVWCEINPLSRIFFGSVTVIIKIDLPSKKPDISFFQDDDSNDFIDCSLQESHMLKTRQAETSGSGGSFNESLRPFSSIRTTATLSSAEAHKSARRSSFLVPATQQLEESISSRVPNGSKLDIEDSVVSGRPSDEATPGTGLLGKDGDDDDGFFFIPETQLDELDCVSEVIGGIVPVGEPTCGVVTQSTEDDYFQMTEQDDDDQNSIDGLFNNKYIEESQNLLQSMDESYRLQAQDQDDRQQPVSILPERSVDSISFHENRNTTQEMSRIEWNESKQVNDQPIAAVLSDMEPDPGQGEAYCGEPDDRTVTPDLVFEKSQGGEKELRNGSATPDLELNSRPGATDRGEENDQTAIPHLDVDKPQDGEKELRNGSATPKQKLDNQPGTTDRGEEDDRTVTPDLDFNKPQDVENESMTGSATPDLNVHLNDQLGATDPGEEDDRTETPDLNFDEPEGAANKKRDSSATPDLELDSKAPQKSTEIEADIADRASVVRASPALCIEEQQEHDQEFEISLNQEGGVPHARNNVYEMETQAFIAGEVEVLTDDVDPYNLSTQPLPREKATVLPAVVRPKRQRKKTESPAKVDEKDLVTQPLTPPPSFVLMPRATRRKRAPEVSSPVAIDPSDLLTQPLSPPRNYLSGGVRKNSTAKTKTTPKATSAVYDLQTQPLSPVPSRMLSDDRFSDKVPVVALIDIKYFRRSNESAQDPYLAATQPLIEDEEGNVYDLQTQPFCSTSRLTAGTGSDLDDSGNHTIPMAVNEQYLETKEEPNVTQFCPKINSTVRQSMIADQQQEEQLKISPSSNKENQVADTLPNEPENEDLEDSFCLSATLPMGELGTGGTTDSNASTKVNKRSTKKTNELMFKLPATKTPAPKKRKPSPFQQFLTPEHSLFACLPKADVIRSSTSAISGLCGSSSHGAVSKHAYPFGDGSSSDSEEDSKVFKKTNVSEAYERELEKSKEDAKRSKLAKEAKTDRQTKSNRSKRTEKPVENKEHEAHGAAEGSASAKTSGVPERKSTRKRESTKKLEAKDSKRTRSKRASESSEPQVVVPKRSRREVRQKIPTIEESVEYDRHSTGVGSGGNEIVPPPRTRKRKERSSEKQEKLLTEATERTTSAAITTTRTSRKKVDASNDNTGREENGSSLVGAAGGVEREALVRGNLSSTSSVASDGSKMSVRTRNRPMIMFTRMDPEPYRAIIARAGGKIVDIPEMATILVTDRIKRTYKFLCAVAKGIPIVGQSYLDALKATDGKDKPVVDPWEHILVDNDSEKRYVFHLRETLLKARQNKLFRDYTVFVTSNTQPPASELFLILSCAGAKPLKNPPSSSSPPINLHKMFVISSPEDAASWVKYREKYPRIEVISSEGFMISIIHHAVSFENYRLL